MYSPIFALLSYEFAKEYSGHDIQDDSFCLR